MKYKINLFFYLYLFIVFFLCSCSFDAQNAFAPDEYVVQAPIQETEVYIPELVIEPCQTTAYIGYHGYPGNTSSFLDQSSINAIWNTDHIPWLKDFSDKEFIYEANATYDDSGTVTVVHLTIYSSQQFYEYHLPFCIIQFVPDGSVLKTPTYSVSDPTCTFWNTPVNAVCPGKMILGCENIQYECTNYSIRFTKEEPDMIDAEAVFYTLDFTEEEIEQIIYDFLYCSISPEHTFSLKHLTQSFPGLWTDDEKFNSYLPSAADTYYLQEPQRTKKPDSDSVKLYYSETKDGAGNYFHWTIQNCTLPIDTVNISKPELWDLRQYNLNADYYDWGLGEQMSLEEIYALQNAIFSVEYLTLDHINGRILSNKESYYSLPYIQIDVAYPDQTIISLRGHYDPELLYEQLK